MSYVLQASSLLAKASYNYSAFNGKFFYLQKKADALET